MCTGTNTYSCMKAELLLFINDKFFPWNYSFFNRSLSFSSCFAFQVPIAQMLKSHIVHPLRSVHRNLRDLQTCLQFLQLARSPAVEAKMLNDMKHQRYVLRTRAHFAPIECSVVHSKWSGATTSDDTTISKFVLFLSFELVQSSPLSAFPHRSEMSFPSIPSLSLIVLRPLVYLQGATEPLYATFFLISSI